jgi:hypothetical protein
MSEQQRYDVTFAGLQTEFGGKVYTHEDVVVTKTSTMTHGSMLVAAGTEAAIADVAVVTGVIDDPMVDFEDVAVGDDVLVSVARRGNVFNTDALTYSDAGAAVPANLTLLNSAQNIFK